MEMSPPDLRSRLSARLVPALLLRVSRVVSMAPSYSNDQCSNLHSSSLNPMRRTEIGEVSIDNNSGYRAVGVVQALANSLEKD